jgi:hypothetical protein
VGELGTEREGLKVFSSCSVKVRTLVDGSAAGRPYGRDWHCFAQRQSAAVDRLEKLGLVIRKSSPTDRRARVVHLTAEGKRLAASCFERHAKDLQALMSTLTQKEKEQLYGFIKKLGLLAAEQLSRQEVTANRTKEQGQKITTITE